MSFWTRSSSILRFPQLRNYKPFIFVRGFRPKKSSSPVKVTPVTTKTDGPEFTKISKYFLYTAVVVPTTFTGCIIWHYENARKITLARLNPKPKQEKKQWHLRDELNHVWNTMSPGKKLAWAFITANVSVFLLWQTSKMTPFLMRYFACSPLKAHSVVSSTLSAFSHQNGLHLFVNMYVLYSFSDILTRIMGKEQFVATYIGAATFSGMLSAIVKILQKNTIPSVGASGALMCMIAIFCYTLPNAPLQIAIVGDFFPHSFKASSALFAVVLFDTLGLFLRWRIFDHAGHLGGVLFGLGMLYLTNSGILKSYRRKVLDTWHSFRK